MLRLGSVDPSNSGLCAGGGVFADDPFYGEWFAAKQPRELPLPGWANHESRAPWRVNSRVKLFDIGYKIIEGSG